MIIQGLPADSDIKVLKDNFMVYLRKTFPDRKEDRHREDRSWAFTHCNYDIGINFWESLRSEAALEQCYQCFYNVALHGGLTGKGVRDPKGYAYSYTSSVRRLKLFLDEVYGGVDKYLESLR